MECRTYPDYFKNLKVNKAETTQRTLTLKRISSNNNIPEMLCEIIYKNSAGKSLKQSSLSLVYEEILRYLYELYLQNYKFEIIAAESIFNEFSIDENENILRCMMFLAEDESIVLIDNYNLQDLKNIYKNLSLKSASACLKNGKEGNVLCLYFKSPDKSSNIKWTAYFNALGGYSESARNFIKGFYENKHPINIFNPPYKKSMKLDLKTRQILSSFSRVKLENNYINIQEVIPENIIIDKQASYNIGRIFFELEKIPDKWQGAISNLDELWISSSFIKRSLINSGIPAEKIFLIPECIDINYYDINTRHYEIPEKKSFVFLSVFDWRLQKGWDILIESFTEAFTGDDDVCLVLKINSSSGFPVREIEKQIFDYINIKLGIKKERMPKVIILDSMLSENEMLMLMNTCSVFVLPSRGEGWGRPYMEAMLMNKPVIATGWGGHLDYINNNNAYLIDCEITDVSESGSTEINNYKGLKWAEPSKKHLVKIMLEIYQNYGEALKKAAIARTDIIKNYNSGLISQRAIQRLEHISKNKIKKEKNIIIEGKFISINSLSSINRNIFKELEKDQDNNFNIKIKSDEDFKKNRNHLKETNSCIRISPGLLKDFCRNIVSGSKDAEADFYIRH